MFEEVFDLGVGYIRGWLERGLLSHCHLSKSLFTHLISSQSFCHVLALTSVAHRSGLIDTLLCSTILKVSFQFRSFIGFVICATKQSKSRVKEGKNKM